MRLNVRFLCSGYIFLYTLVLRIFGIPAPSVQYFKDVLTVGPFLFPNQHSIYMISLYQEIELEDEQEEERDETDNDLIFIRST